MSFHFFIVDDDASSRRMLQKIIEEKEIGQVLGTAENGVEAENLILQLHPEVVLIDLLMPEQDGLETMDRLKQKGFNGYFIMISQVTNKEMVGEAYQKGVEFFIHKPINRIEVETLLQKIKDQLILKRSLTVIKESLAGMETRNKPKVSARSAVLSILNDMGIAGESGSQDLISIIEYLQLTQVDPMSMPPLKELYEVIAQRNKPEQDQGKESKAIEQRVRRAIFAAMDHLSSLGLMDYTHPKFEHYATRFFDFQDVRQRMREMENEEASTKTKVNIKKFLQLLYIEVQDKLLYP
ncbi:response regulator [Ammoniphilus resinae]|uniref:Two-component system response regulator YcbB n=1 Tax=Ammoniphilus resinae TaxID=861532 RepID=A0ABS4GV26_9BACL|nr:response regulator [Ammoniphilus resinae]MBP1934112.1 two-component system response regulator YcbB [Ammoniphilus resinae]